MFASTFILNLKSYNFLLRVEMTICQSFDLCNDTLYHQGWSPSLGFSSWSRGGHRCLTISMHMSSIAEPLVWKCSLPISLGGHRARTLGSLPWPDFFFTLKGTLARDCWPLVFSWIDHIWASDSHRKIFSNSVSNSRRYSDLSVYQRCRMQLWFKFYLKIGKDFYLNFSI